MLSRVSAIEFLRTYVLLILFELTFERYFRDDPNDGLYNRNRNTLAALTFTLFFFLFIRI